MTPPRPGAGRPDRALRSEFGIGKADVQCEKRADKPTKPKHLMKKLLPLLIASLLAFAVGCKEKSPTEKAVDKTKEAVKDGAEAVKDGAKKTGEAIKEGAEKVGEKAKEIVK